MLGIYIHIPFCRQKCFYCDFVSYADMDTLWAKYVEALKSEIILQTRFLSASIDTVYIGGGTPTVLPTSLLVDLLEAIQGHFSIAPNAEITVEANPGTVDEVKLMALKAVGVNRLSFGVQSFQDQLLRKIGRIHTAEEAEQAIKLAKKCGFKNISLDLMYGLPGQGLSDVAQSIEVAVALDPQHISIYGLKVEEGTPFDVWQQKGALTLPDDDDEAIMYTEVMATLPRFGYKRYEISNFAKQGFESRHNSKYWRYRPYVGLGAGAHSFNKGKRYTNTSDVAEYIMRLENGVSSEVFCETLTPKAMMEEYCFLALRMQEGISGKGFAEYFGCSLTSVYGSTIEKLVANRLAMQVDDRVRLTPLGMQYGNQAFCEFILI